MDRYHSIVGPMVCYHWKPLKNNRVQWLLDYKTIEKPLVPMVFGPKTIGKTIAYNGFWTKKTLENHCYQLFWRPKTIVKPLISMVVFQSFGKNLIYHLLNKNFRKYVKLLLNKKRVNETVNLLLPSQTLTSFPYHFR